MRTKDYEQRTVEKDNEVIGIIADSAIRFSKDDRLNRLTACFAMGRFR